MDIPDEYDTTHICRLIEKHRRIMIRALYGGCGKSYCAEFMSELGYKVLFVVPTNRLRQERTLDSITLNQFFSVGVSDNDPERKGFDDSGYNVIVFDEIYFTSIGMLARVKSNSESHPNKIIIAAGDCSQLPPVNFGPNRVNFKTYADQCIDTIFPKSMMLKVPKRLKSEEDKQLLVEIAKDIFDKDTPTETTLRKYFRFTSDINTTDNIAYKNDTCGAVTKIVRKQIGKVAEYEAGETLVCREYFVLKRVKLNCNYEYIILEVKEKELVIKGTDGSPLVVSIETVRKKFIHNYCRTCHSLQGSSINGMITIFDWNLWCSTREWLYTAITRATDFKNVRFYDGGSEDITEQLLERYLQQKLCKYRKQDRDGGRAIDEANYVDCNWLRGCFGGSCSGCGTELSYWLKNSKVQSNLTADRIDNDLDHNKYNVIPMCVSCNTSKSCR